MEKEPNAETLAVWTRLIRAGNTVLSAVQDALKKAGLPPLEWYDVLLEIEKAGKAGIRPNDLIDTLVLPQYGLSRLLTRLETAGLIRREATKGDGRGQVVFLTKEGRATRKKMWPVYATVLQERIGDRLELGEALRLGQYLQHLTTAGGESPR